MALSMARKTLRCPKPLSNGSATASRAMDAHSFPEWKRTVAVRFLAGQPWYVVLSGRSGLVLSGSCSARTHRSSVVDPTTGTAGEQDCAACGVPGFACRESVLHRSILSGVSPRRSSPSSRREVPFLARSTSRSNASAFDDNVPSICSASTASSRRWRPIRYRSRARWDVTTYQTAAAMIAARVASATRPTERHVDPSLPCITLTGPACLLWARLAVYGSVNTLPRRVSQPVFLHPFSLSSTPGWRTPCPTEPARRGALPPAASCETRSGATSFPPSPNRSGAFQEGADPHRGAHACFLMQLSVRTWVRT